MKSKLLALSVLTLSTCVSGAGQVRAQETNYKKALQAAYNNFVAGNYDDAKKQYEEALPLASTSTEKAKVLTALGTLSYTTKDYVLAVADLNQVLEMEGVDKAVRSSAQLYVAKVYKEQKNLARAHEEFAAYLSDPDLAPMARVLAQQEVAQIYLDEKDFEQARSTWAEMTVTLEDKILANMDNTLAQSFKALAQIGISQAFVGEHDFARAREALAQAAGIVGLRVSTRLRIQYELAQSYVLEKNYAQARAEFTKMLMTPGIDPASRARAEKRLKMLADLDALVAQLEKGLAAEAQAPPRAT